jgi:hypothetical protein
MKCEKRSFKETYNKTATYNAIEEVEVINLKRRSRER